MSVVLFSDSLKKNISPGFDTSKTSSPSFVAESQLNSIFWFVYVSSVEDRRLTNRSALALFREIIQLWLSTGRLHFWFLGVDNRWYVFAYIIECMT